MALAVVFKAHAHARRVAVGLDAAVFAIVDAVALGFYAVIYQLFLIQFIDINSMSLFFKICKI